MVEASYSLAAAIRHHGPNSTEGHFTTLAKRDGVFRVYDDGAVRMPTEHDRFGVTASNWRLAAYSSARPPTSTSIVENIDFDEVFRTGPNQGGAETNPGSDTSARGEILVAAPVAIDGGGIAKRVADVDKPKAKDVKFSGEATYPPSKADPIPARGEGETRLFPCNVDETLDPTLVDELFQTVSTEEWKTEAAKNDPFGDVGEAIIPEKKKKKKKKNWGAPLPQKAGGSSTKPVSETAGENPLDFIPGGATSSKVNTPLTYADGKKSDVQPTKTYDPVATDTNTSSTSTGTSQGWGDLFASQKQQWKCDVCLTHNPLDETNCLSCGGGELKGGIASKSDANSGNKTTGSTKKASEAPASAAPSAGSIGAGWTFI